MISTVQIGRCYKSVLAIEIHSILFVGESFNSVSNRCYFVEIVHKYGLIKESS